MKRAIFLFLLLSLPNVAHAANWKYAINDINDSIFYVDVDSIYKSNSGLVMYWDKTLYKNKPNTTPNTVPVYNGHKAWYSLSLNGEDCGGGVSYLAYQVITYGLNGQVIYNYEAPSYDQPSGVRPAPETIGDAVHNFICNYWALRPTP